MDISAYLEAIRDIYSHGKATEHSYRPALETLFKSIDTSSTGDTGSTALEVINEPRRLTEVGAPDFVFLRGGTAIGWCEAKDIGKDIRRFAATGYSKEQKARYIKGLPNLIYTNMLDFEFIRDGEPIAFVSIAEAKPDLPERRKAFAELEKWLCDFAAQSPARIGTAEQLAERMAGKTALIKDIMGQALECDKANATAGQSATLIGQYEAFKDNLIHGILVADFADIYAETIAYGLFAARLHDETPGKFSRIRVPDLLPKSNPFLRSLFGYIAGVDVDERIRRVIDELCDIFRVADLHEIFKDFGRSTNRIDPFLHFYETFLAAYNPAKRKARGVWYTPEAVVHFIVRAVDDVLKTDFDLAEGLADTSRVTIDWDDHKIDAKGNAIPITEKRDVHRVQILDPATGTGTFLAEVIKLLAERVQHTAPGAWSSYVEHELIPRLHGFELLMASYAMCHMRLDMMLTAKDYKPTGESPRLSVYLTNSLEEDKRDEKPLPFAQWLADEAKGANIIKRQTPIMCVIGNPPYAGHSSNKGPWIKELMKDYKVSPELKRPAQAKWLSDDYVKFIRFADHMIAKNGEGVLGFITNHGYLDNPTFLDMRNHLLKTFNKIYVLDLHGNANKKEVCPDGSPDKNVFDIKQGVAIIIAVKKKVPTGDKVLAKVWHGELWGSREGKYKALQAGRLNYEEITPENPHWRFKPFNKAIEKAYFCGFSVADLFSPNGKPAPGIVTTQDQFAISWTKQEAAQKIVFFLSTSTEQEARTKFRLCSTNQWNYETAKKTLESDDWRELIMQIAYRPLDTRYTVFHSSVAVHRRERVMRHMMSDNLAFQTLRQKKSPGLYQDIFVHRGIAESGMISNKSAEISYSFPLYLYDTFNKEVRINFDSVIYAEICAKAGLCPISPDTPRDEKDFPGDFRAATGEARRDEVKVFDYIYGVLYSPDYRETYTTFLKIDFPRIPYPVSPEVFARISEKGEALRRLHLMEEAAIGATAFRFEGHGDSVVERPRFSAASAAVHAGASAETHGSTGETPKGRVYINQRQYFSGVSSLVWNFPIGGYYPAQKWLKDRKGRALSFDDIRHYQKICKILAETRQIMKQISSPLA